MAYSLKQFVWMLRRNQQIFIKLLQIYQLQCDQKQPLITNLSSSLESYELEIYLAAQMRILGLFGCLAADISDWTLMIDNRFNNSLMQIQIVKYNKLKKCLDFQQVVVVLQEKIPLWSAKIMDAKMFSMILALEWLTLKFQCYFWWIFSPKMFSTPLA